MVSIKGVRMLNKLSNFFRRFFCRQNCNYCEDFACKRMYKKLNKSIKSVRTTRGKWLATTSKNLWFCLKTINAIEYPKNDEERKTLAKLISIYDEHISLLEQDFISKKRDYLK